MVTAGTILFIAVAVGGNAYLLISGIAAYKGTWRTWAARKSIYQFGKQNYLGFFRPYLQPVIIVATLLSLVTILGAEWVTDLVLLLTICWRPRYPRSCPAGQTAGQVPDFFRLLIQAGSCQRLGDLPDARRRRRRRSPAARRVAVPCTENARRAPCRSGRSVCTVFPGGGAGIGSPPPRDGCGQPGPCCRRRSQLCPGAVHVPRSGDQKTP